MMPVWLLVLVLDDWLDPSLLSNMFMVGADCPAAPPLRADIVALAPPTPASPHNVVEPDYEA